VADGAPLWARAAATPRPPASLIKLLAALVLLRHDWSPDASVTVSARAAAVTGSRIGLRAGDSLTAGDALVAMLVRSANDACLALAEHAAGSSDAFAGRMNELAVELGLAETHVVHPCGLDRPGQASSARDLLQVATAALERPEIAAIVAMRTARIRTTGGRTLTMHNGNALLGRADGVRGMKTGYTNGAGKCLIAVAERRGHRVWLVMLNAPNRWWVASGMLDAAFRSL
jgi:D-alanyl-D-alanine carboxypeptidase (penicillin-binding protein 5/6)